MRPLAAACLVALLYVLHQDVWFWRAARPLVFGVLPVGLFYHAAFTLACSILLWLLVRYTWPSHLESASVRLKADPTHDVRGVGLPPSREASADRRSLGGGGQPDRNSPTASDR